MVPEDFASWTKSEIVGNAYTYADEKMQTIGDVLLDENGIFELNICYVPTVETVELAFERDVGQRTSGLQIVVQSPGGSRCFPIGRADIDGLTGKVVFYGQPLTDGRLRF